MRTDLFIKVLTVLELVCYALLMVNRINVVTAIRDVNEDLRQIITFYDYERGWNLVFLSILLVSCALTFTKKKLSWVLRQTGLISLALSFLIPFDLVAVLAVFLSAVYAHKQVMTYFGVTDQKWKYIAIVTGGVVLLTAMRWMFDIISY